MPISQPDGRQRECMGWAEGSGQCPCPLVGMAACGNFALPCLCWPLNIRQADPAGLPGKAPSLAGVNTPFAPLDDSPVTQALPRPPARRCRDPAVDESYGQEEECLVKGRGELGGAYIVRLPCGPTNQYVRKELLWPYVREFADRGIAHANAMLAAMADAGRRCELYVVHGEGRGGRRAEGGGRGCAGGSAVRASGVNGAGSGRCRASHRCRRGTARV